MSMGQVDQSAPPSVPQHAIAFIGDNSLTTSEVIFGALATGSVAALAYHGYKRNNSVGWAVTWALVGGLMPVISLPVAFAQGFGKPIEGQ